MAMLNNQRVHVTISHIIKYHWGMITQYGKSVECTTGSASWGRMLALRHGLFSWVSHHIMQYMTMKKPAES